METEVDTTALYQGAVIRGSDLESRMSGKLLSVDEMRVRLQQLDQVIAKQKAFLARIPDPDNRERADGHLLQLIDMREDIARRYAAATLP